MASPSPLAFDHAGILAAAVERIRGKLDYAPIGFELLPDAFTLLELRRVHEAILGRPLNKDSFRRKILDRGLVEPTGERATGLGHRPPELYRFVRPAVGVAADDRLRPRPRSLPLVEPLAVLTGIACVALTVREQIGNWPVGIVSSALFLVLFLSAGLYADSLLQVAVRRAGLLRLVALAHGRPPRQRPPGHDGIAAASGRAHPGGDRAARWRSAPSSMGRRTPPSPTRTPPRRCSR